MTIKFTKKDIFSIPNIMSFFRITLIPAIIALYIKYKNYVATVIIIAVSGITDILDGWIARKFNMISDFGKILDPIADKLTQLVILCCLLNKYPNIIIVICCLVIKEAITAITGFISIHYSKKVNSADWHGKMTTCILYATMVTHIIWITIPNSVSNALIATCTIMMLISFILYTIQNGKSIIESK